MIGTKQDHDACPDCAMQSQEFECSGCEKVVCFHSAIQVSQYTFICEECYETKE